MKYIDYTVYIEYTDIDNNYDILILCINNHICVCFIFYFQEQLLSSSNITGGYMNSLISNGRTVNWYQEKSRELLKTPEIT